MKVNPSLKDSLHGKPKMQTVIPNPQSGGTTRSVEEEVRGEASAPSLEVARKPVKHCLEGVGLEQPAGGVTMLRMKDELRSRYVICSVSKSPT